MINKSEVPVFHKVKTEKDELELREEASIESVQKSVEQYQTNFMIGMLTKPRKTLELIYSLEYSPVWAFLLMSCAGVCFALNQFVMLSDGSISSLIIAIFYGAITGILLGCLGSLILFLSGRLFKGTGTYKRVLIAWGWSCVPSFFLLIIWALRFSVLGPEFFTGEPIQLPEGDLAGRILIYLTMFSVIFMVWQMLLTIYVMEVAHRFSFMSALLSCLTPFGALTLLFFIFN